MAREVDVRFLRAIDNLSQLVEEMLWAVRDNPRLSIVERQLRLAQTEVDKAWATYLDISE